MKWRVAVLLAGLALGLLAWEAAADTAALSLVPRELWGQLFLLVVGWSLMLAALLTRRRRRTSLLLFSAGAVWFIREFDSPSVGSALLFTAGLVLYAACAPILLHLALSYPSGLLPSRPQKLLVIVGYLIMVGVLGLGVALVFDPAPSGCLHCPANLLATEAQPDSYEWLNRLGVNSGAVWLVVAIGALCWRIVAAGGAERRASGLVRLCVLGYLVASAAYFLGSTQSGFLDTAGSWRWHWLAEGVSIVVLSTAVMAELGRNRRSRRALARSVIPLATSPTSELRQTLSVRYEDPQFTVAYPVEGGRRYVDASGRAIDVSPPDGLVATRLQKDRVEFGVIIHRQGVLASQQQVDDLITSVRLGLEHERLQAEALVQMADLRSSGVRIVAAADSERRRIERDLHDGAQQRLIGLLLSLQLLSETPAGQTPEFAAAKATLRRAIDELRQLARGIYPVLLKDAGLAPALSALEESLEVTIDTVPQRRFPDVIETTVYEFVAQLSNYGRTRVSIEDNDGLLSAKVTVEGTLGALHDLPARASTLGGTLTVDDTQGTVDAVLELPVRSNLSVDDNFK